MSNKFCKVMVSRSLTKDLSLVCSDREFREALTNIAVKQIVLVLGTASSDNKLVKIINDLQPTIQILRSNQSSLANDCYWGNGINYCLSLLDYRSGSKRGNSSIFTEGFKESGHYTKVFKLTDKGLVCE